MALIPMRPMVLTLPVPAMPYTKVPKINGAMMDLIRRRKTLDSAAIHAALPMLGKIAPTTTPTTIAMKIQAVSDRRFTGAPGSSLAPLQFLAQHIEEEHLRWTNQVHVVLGALAHHAIILEERLAHLPIHGEKRLLARGLANDLDHAGIGDQNG